MNGIGEKLDEIARRKERLVARAEAQRSAVADGFHRLRGPIGVIDCGIEAGRFLRAHPVLLAAGVAVLVAFRRRGVFAVAGRAYSAWQAWRALSAWAVKARV